jgi:catechol 2,3-dioxygenase-like lactoylglutathione lyase family enzyme
VRAEHLFAALPVAEYATARSWYETFFGRPPDLVPHETEAAWKLNAGAWIYVVGDPQRAGGGLLTVLVEDLDERLAALADRGIAVGLVETYGSGARKAIVQDPDGNEIGLGQVR